MKLAIIPIACLMILPSYARADEPSVGWRAEPRVNLYQKIAGSSCGRYITPAECRKIRDRNEARRRYSEDRGPRRDRDYDDDRGSSCRSAISVEGRERTGRDRAVESAENAWANSARARHGYAFGSINKARGKAQDCNPIRSTLIGGKVWVCSLTARPCRDSQ